MSRKIAYELMNQDLRKASLGMSYFIYVEATASGRSFSRWLRHSQGWTSLAFLLAECLIL